MIFDIVITISSIQVMKCQIIASAIVNACSIYMFMCITMCLYTVLLSTFLSSLHIFY